MVMQQNRASSYAGIVCFINSLLLITAHVTMISVLQVRGSSPSYPELSISLKIEYFPDQIFCLGFHPYLPYSTPSPWDIP